MTVSYVRQAPTDDGWLDRGVWVTREELEKDMSRPGARGARGIVRDDANGECLVIIEPTLPTCCRQHWEAASGRHAVAVGAALVNPAGMPFMVCKKCGNKRCPRATDCELECTNSNEPGQAGSIYGVMT